MAMMPARVKYRKHQRGRIRGNAWRGNRISYGDFGLQSLESGWVTGRQIEAGRVATSHFLQREGRVIVRIFPHKSVSGKPLETRMGKGKGPLESWVAVIRPATILFEVDGVTEVVARECLRLAANKLPIRTRFISRHHHA